MLSVGKIVRKSQPSLFWCMRSLSKAKREAIFTLFAFCRHLDNIIQSPMSDEEKIELFSAWQEELDNIYDKKVPATNIGRKIYKNCMRFNLPKELMVEILNSALLNATSPIQAPENDVFEKYIYGYAVVPFYLSLMIIGDTRPSIREELAKSLGNAIIITYILRDIKDDALNNRLYIPKEMLEQSGVILGETPRTVVESKYLSNARELLAQRAEKGYSRANRILSKMNKNNMLTLHFIKNVGEIQFNMMKERGWEVISPKPKVGFWKRLHIAFNTIFK